MSAYKRLPEFSGLIGKVYPGQLKPRHHIPEPRIQFMKKLYDDGFRGTGSDGLLMPPLINVKPV